MTGVLDTSRRLLEGWRWVRLVDICEINPRRDDTGRADESPTSFIPMEAVDAVSGTINRVQERPYHEVSKGYTFVREHDVLFAKITPCMQNGKHAVARGLIAGFGFASTEFHVIRPIAAVLSEWVHHFLRQPDVLLEASKHFAGAVGQQRVPADFLKALLLPLPPFKDQCRITGLLKEQMAAAEKARMACEVRLEAAKALPAALLSNVFEVPRYPACETRRLGDILIPHKEMIHPGDRESGTMEFVGLEHIEPHTGCRFGSLTLDLGYLTGRKPTFRRGQIVYGYLRPYLNKVWIAEFDGCSSVDQYAYGVRDDLADVRYIAWFLRSPTYLRRSQIMTTTGQLPRIGTEQIAAVEIGLPPLDRQRAVADEIEDRFATFHRLREAIWAEADTINALPAALLRRAFNGDI